MNIYIEEINATGLGPLKEFSQTFGLVNLIYGHNERGKTFLVEFIIQSLFRNYKDFHLRSLTPTGKVAVSGFNQHIIQFSPNSREKLDDYIDDFGLGLPTNFSKLMVVKGAELDFDVAVPGGMDKNCIRSFLSSEDLLKRIHDKVPATIRNSELQNGLVMGKRQGLLKTRDLLNEELNYLNNLYIEISEKVSGGTLNKFITEKIEIKEKIKLQEKAKAHKAYLIQQELLGKQSEFEEFSKRKLEELISAQEEYLRQVSSKDKIETDLHKASEKSKNYEWLKNALIEYEKLAKQVVERQIHSRGGMWIWFWFATGLVLVSVGAGVSLFSQYFLIPIIIGILALGVSGFLFFKKENYERTNSKLEIDIEEFKRLEVEFEEKLGEKLFSKITIQTAIDSEEQSYHLANQYMTDLNKAEEGILRLSDEITSYLTKFNLKPIPETERAGAIQKLENKRSNVQDDIRKLEINLSGMNIHDSAMLQVFDGDSFDEIALAKLQDDKFGVQTQIDAEEKKLAEIKTKAISNLRLGGNPSWEDIISKIQLSLLMKKKEHKDSCSEIIAKFIVHQVINKIELDEDEKIKNALNNPVIQGPIKEITKKYNGLSLDKDQILVNADYEDFYLSDLSTGAREQVLLGVRLGLVTKLFADKKGFLIFDDAFQHSDYVRREQLVNIMFELAKRNWQIIYFSMDDHIASLFDEKGERLGNKYCRRNL